MRRAACLGGLLLAAAVRCVGAAAPAVWVEAALEPAAVPVNAQATFVLRFGHAVDVRAPELDAPAVRLAEVRPLGPATRGEEERHGRRYRVLERRFAVLPFASGEMILRAEVRGRTPAALPQAGAGGRLALASPPLTLQVGPAGARAGTDWLPARNLVLAASASPPPRLRVGEVWSRQITIEADGVDGSVIAPTRWPASADWSWQVDVPEVGTRIERGRLIGYRRQTVHAQALRAGRLTLPALAVAWWRVPEGRWVESALPAVEVEAVEAKPSSGVAKDSRLAAPVRGQVIAWSAGLVALAALLVGIFGRRVRDAGCRRFARWRAKRRLLAACAANDAAAARLALLAWAAWRGVKVRTLGAFADRARLGGGAALAAAIDGLDRACYGASPTPWRGRALADAVRRPLPAMPAGWSPAGRAAAPVKIWPTGDNEEEAACRG